MTEIVTPSKTTATCQINEVAVNTIVRRVAVNRSRSFQEALGATNRVLYTNQEVVDSMPKGKGDEVELVFFKPDLSESNAEISDRELEKEFELRGLKSDDPISVIAFNEADPAFADEKPHVARWKDVNGNWCYAAFDCCGGKRAVIVRCGERYWGGSWWFVGVRK